MSPRRRGRAALWLVAFVAAAFGACAAWRGLGGGASTLLGSYTDPGEPAVVQTAKEEPDVTPSTLQAGRASIPPVDKAVPAKLETATFALG